MARYKDPEQRLEDIEKMVKSIKHTVDSMQRRAVIIMILRLLRLFIIVAIILWVYHGLQPFIENLGEASVRAQETADRVDSITDGAKGFINQFTGGGEAGGDE